MIDALLYIPLRLVSGVIAIGWWARRHPRWATVVMVFAVVYITAFVIGSAAHADPVGAAHPDLAGDDLVDPNGVRASHYGSLFIATSKGFLGAGDPSMSATAWLLNLTWSGIFNGIVNALGLFRWVAEFSWVQVIATPAEGIAIIVNRFLNQFQLTTFAFALCGVVAGFYVMRNKWPAALVEVGMTIALSILAAGLFANPIQWLTAPNGPLDDAQDFGGQVSAALSGSGYLEGEAGKKDVIDDTITAPLVQVFVADANQVLSFGHILKGDCAKTFYKTVGEITPNDSNAGATVHNAVAACDKDAATYADNPSVLQFPEEISVAGGTLGLFVAGMLFAVLAIGCVIMLFWDGLRLMISTILGMFPFADRSKFWKALMGVFACLVGVVLLTGMLALYLSALCQILTGIMSLGIPLMMVMNVITVLIIVVFLLLIWQIVSIRKRGQKVGEFLHDKLEQSRHFNPGPVMALPAVASLAAAKQLIPKKKPQQREPVLGGNEDNRIQTANFFGGSSSPTQGPHAGSSPIDLGNVPSTPGSGPRSRRTPGGALTGSAPVPGLAAGATRAAGTALRLGKAASGGVGTLALEAGKMAARKATSRILVDKNGAGTVQRGSTDKDAAHAMGKATTDPGITKHTPARRIAVSSDGVGRVLNAARPTYVVPPTMGPQP